MFYFFIFLGNSKNLQGWEFAQWFFEQIARFLQKMSE